MPKPYEYRVLDLKRTLTYRLARMQAKLNAQASELIERHCGLSLSEWRILAVLSDVDVRTQKDVLKLIGMDKGQASRTIKKLQDQSLISIDFDLVDNRVRTLALTDAGWDIIKTMHPIMTKRQAHIRSDLSDDELSSLIDMIDRVEAKSNKLNDEDLLDE